MNAKRRKQVAEAITHIGNAKEILESVLDEEQDAMDNMPESLMDTDRYSHMEDAVESIESAIDLLDDAVDDLQTAST